MSTTELETLRRRLFAYTPESSGEEYCVKETLSLILNEISERRRLSIEPDPAPLPLPLPNNWRQLSSAALTTLRQQLAVANGASDAEDVAIANAYTALDDEIYARRSGDEPIDYDAQDRRAASEERIANQLAER